MKKISTLIISFLLALTLIACADKQIEHDTLYVYFFTGNGAQPLASLEDVEPGAKIEVPQDPVRDGYDFVGWYKDRQLTEAWDFDTDVMPGQSIVLYAKWGILERNIIYELYGGEFNNPATVPYTFMAGDIKVLPQVKKTGYQFKGWYLYAPDTTKYPNTDGTKPGDAGINSIPVNQTTDLYVYAHYSVIKVTVTYRHNHPNGAASGLSHPKAVTFAYGTEITYGENFPTFPDTAGYTFVGWNSKADGTGDWINDGSLWTRTQPATIYAQWQAI